jgi:hypothetical protein
MGRAIDLTGQRFERLLVLEYAGKSAFGVTLWRCVCDCGHHKTVLRSGLRNGDSKSCGCLRKEIASARLTGNKHTLKHGHSGDATYNSWSTMKDRCLNPNATGYLQYGGTGISVCDRWKDSFENFLTDMGERPPGTTLGRFGDTGNYEPGNVVWMTSAEQVANRRPDRKYRGKKQNQEQIAA